MAKISTSASFVFKYSDGTLFSWGLCMGMVYTMSAGRANIEKVSATVDEIAKVVEELKFELFKKRSSSCSMESRSEDANDEHSQRGIDQIRMGLRDSNKAFDPLVSVGGEYASSVLSEEADADPKIQSMEEMEAELEAELQKLHWSPMEAGDKSTLSQV